VKVDDLNTINAVNPHPVGKNTPGAQHEKVDVRQQDRVKLSTRKTEIEKFSNRVADMPDVRSDKVAELKQRISEGTYKVDGAKVAEKMIDHIKGFKDTGGSE
jgi:flagellar biosynthesis anti-sigma factor FlgM